MPAGLTVYNDYGTMLVDDTNYNLALKSKGTVTPMGGPPYAANYTVASTITPIFAYRVPSTTINTQMISRTYNAGTTTCLAGGPTPGFGNVTFYCFDLPGAPGGDNVGLQVFSAAGNLCFDSRLQHPVIAAAHLITSTAVVTLTLTPGRTYAIASDLIYMCIDAHVVKLFPQPVNVGQTVIVVDVTGY